MLCDPNDFGQSSPDWSEFHKEILQVSCKMGTSRMMILIKSWLNSWTASSCMEQEIGDCVFCCGGEGEGGARGVGVFGWGIGRVKY